MVLPPENGLDKNGKSYGDVRQLLMTSENSVGSLGCSNIEHRALSAGGEGCHGAHCIDVCDTDAGTFFCWFRCMNLEEHSAHECDSVGLPIQCINPRDQVSDGFSHGDYYPACSDSTANVTDYPKLEQYPQDPDVCTDAEWTAFSDSSDYMHVFDLSNDFTTAKFMWTINADGLVEGRIAFNGLFGWLAVGLLNLTPGAGHKGMNGASILMAVPGGDYSAADGFDLSLEPTIKEYKIDEYGSAHRHWQTPIADSTSSVSTTLVNNDECFTSFEFVADGINSIPFNTSGSDVLLWAGNTEDYYAGYHGLNRARFEVNWATGDAKFVVDETDDDNNGDGEEEEDEESSSSKLFVSTSIASVALLSAMLI